MQPCRPRQKRYGFRRMHLACWSNLPVCRTGLDCATHSPCVKPRNAWVTGRLRKASLKPSRIALRPFTRCFNKLWVHDEFGPVFIPRTVRRAPRLYSDFLGVSNMHDLINGLRLDPGTRTLGQLLQEREWAVNEIARLRRQNAQLPSKTAASKAGNKSRSQSTAPPEIVDSVLSSHRLLRMSDICLLVGLSRAAIYKLRSAGRFPAPVELGLKSVRWRLADVLAWQA